MKKVIRLTESDLKRIVKRVISEQTKPDISECIKGIKDLPKVCDVNDKSYKPESCLMSVITMKQDVEAINCIKSKLQKNGIKEGKVWDTIKKPFDKLGNTILQELIYRQLENGLEDYIINRIEKEYGSELDPEFFKYSVNIEGANVIIKIVKGPTFVYDTDNKSLTKV